MSQEWTSEHVLRLGSIILVGLFVVVMMINVSHVITRMKTHSMLANYYQKEKKQMEQLPLAEWTPEQKKRYEMMSKYLKEDNYTELANMIYDPVVNSRFGKNIDWLFWHTTLGRTTMEAQLELNQFIRGALASFYGFMLNSFLQYVISISDFKGESHVNALLIATIFCVLVIVGISQINIHIESRMKSNSIIADDDATVALNSSKSQS